MHLTIISSNGPTGGRHAFTLVETAVAMLLVGVTFTALYAGVTYGIHTIRRSEETLQASQIMSEKLDTIRLHAWDKIRTPGYLPAKFTNQFAAGDSKLNAAGYEGGRGVSYFGTITLASNLPVDVSYRSNLVQVTVSLRWTRGKTPRQASMSTFVAKDGIQSYIY